MGVGVEVVDGLDEADAAHLEQVVDVLAPGGEALDHAEHQPQIPGDQLLPGGLVSLPDPEKQLTCALRGQH